MLEVGQVDPELAAEGVGFSEGVGGDRMGIAPVLVLRVGRETALVFLGGIDEKSDGRGHGFAEFLGEGCFTVSEIGQEDEPGIGYLGAASP